MSTTDEHRARIHAAIRAIPRGEVAGYGDIARRAGMPGRARLVARLLSGADDDTLPWFRVLRSDGRIAFPASDPLFEDQRRTLIEEGVRVDNGRVRMPGREVTLDEAVWGPDA